jgi:hypothetical protein
METEVSATICFAREEPDEFVLWMRHPSVYVVISVQRSISRAPWDGWRIMWFASSALQ